MPPSFPCRLNGLFSLGVKFKVKKLLSVRFLALFLIGRFLSQIFRAGAVAMGVPLWRNTPSATIDNAHYCPPLSVDIFRFLRRLTFTVHPLPGSQGLFFPVIRI
jgi:hypothetical protein